MKNADLINSIGSAANIAGNLVSRLQEANTYSDAVTHIVLLQLINKAAELSQEIRHLSKALKERT